MQDVQPTAEQSLTFHVKLVLDNDHGTYLRRREIVQEFMASDDAEFPHLLGDQLEEWAREIVGLEDTENEPNLLAIEVLSTALGHVDWRGLAESYIEDENES